MSPRGRPSRRQRERSEQKQASPGERGQLVPGEREAPEVRRFAVEAGEAGQRLDRILAARLPELSRGGVRALIAQGLVRGDGAALTAASRPAAGVQVEVRLAERHAPAPQSAPLALAVLYEDEALLVVDKPAGVAVHPGKGLEGPTLLDGLLHHLRGTGAQPLLVHRLDRGTSGCLAIAKSQPALRALLRAFQGREVDKRYRALAHGAPPDTGDLQGFHGRDPAAPHRFTCRLAEGARAHTRYRVLARAPGAALLEVELLTGRRHQIRVHLAEAGFPLVGDPLYGGAAPASGPAREAALALGRQALHAHALAFAHPLTGASLSFTAPLPADLRAALALLGL